MRRNDTQVHTVRLARSHAGFGFTITGQQPCVLSCIVRGSPAYEVGLRAGDLVVGVNGEDVTSSQHDDVVRRIGNSGPTITLQIMERRHRSRAVSSSSSDLSVDENVSPNKHHNRRTDARQRRHHRRHRHRSASHRISDVGQGAVIAPSAVLAYDANNASRRRSDQASRSHTRPTRHSVEEARPIVGMNHAQHHNHRSAAVGVKKRSRAESDATVDVNIHRATLKHVFPNALVPPPQLRPSGEIRPDDTYEQPVGSATSFAYGTSGAAQTNEPVIRTLIGYCGSVEIPAEGGSWNKLNSIRSALARLKTEAKTVHILVIFDVLPSGVRLVNHHGQVTAEYAANRIVYYGGHPEDERYFGLVVTISGGRPCFSCHMFRVLDPDHCRHDLHRQDALAWGITCHVTSRGGCREFPSSPGPILRCLGSVCGSQKHQQPSPSPRPAARGPRPQSVPPHSVAVSLDVRVRSRSPETRPGSVPPHRDPLEDKLSPRALWRVPAPAPAQPSAAEPEFKKPQLQPRPVSVVGTRTEKEAPATLSAMETGASKNEKSILSKQNSLSQHSMTEGESVRGSKAATSMSHNTTLAHSEKSVYKTVTKEVELDDDLSRVAKWATSFDSLLSDRQGVEIFTDFLRSEYSEENILFWLMVEKFKRIQDNSYRRFRAQEIFSRHLASDAPEPVNVDASARETVEAVLKDQNAVVQSTLFAAAQLQIYNLMRLDSYSRFLKSDAYKNCMVGELELRPLPRSADSSTLVTPERGNALKSAKSSTSLGHPDSEEKKRRSLFPWIRRSKRYNKSTSGSNVAVNSSDSKKPSKSPSRSVSKKEGDFDSVKGHCRITFPDGSSTVIGPSTWDPQMTVRQCLQSVCSKRGIALHATEVVCNSHPERVLDLSATASTLGGKSLNLESRVVFRLEIPSRHKILGVRVKANKSLKEVIKLVCARYNLRMEDCVCTMEASQDNSVSLDVGVKELDHTTLVLHIKDDMSEWGGRPRTPGAGPASQPIVEWLSAPWVTFDQSGIYDPQSPGPAGKASTVREKKADRRSGLRKSTSGVFPSRSPYPDPNDTEDERFLELLTRMTNQRLDDQRGHLSGAALELPDFLKPRAGPDLPPRQQAGAPGGPFPVTPRTSRESHGRLPVHYIDNPQPASHTARPQVPAALLAAQAQWATSRPGNVPTTSVGTAQPHWVSSRTGDVPATSAAASQPHWTSSRTGDVPTTSTVISQPHWAISRTGDVPATSTVMSQPHWAISRTVDAPTTSTVISQPYWAISTSGDVPTTSPGAGQSHWAISRTGDVPSTSPTASHYFRAISQASDVSAPTSGPPGLPAAAPAPLNLLVSPDLPYMDASSVLTSTPRSKGSPVFVGEARGRGEPLAELTTPPPPSFRDLEASGRGSRSTPSPSTHLLLLDSPQHPQRPPSFLQLDDERVTFV